jgi:hypothetical protein
MITRRTMLRRLAAGAPLLFVQPILRLTAATPIAPAVFSEQDDAFLDELERTTFQYFATCAHPETGLVKDRNRTSGADDREVASIAATGFGLTAVCIADERGWLRHSKLFSVRARRCAFSATRCHKSTGFLSFRQLALW